MKTIPLLVLLLLLLAPPLPAAPLADNITAEALIVTKAELRRHMAADEGDKFRPATYRDLETSREVAQPDYLVVRFLTKRLGHYTGEAEARFDGANHGIRLNVMLHFNKGWVEYFIPIDGMMYGLPGKTGAPQVEVVWKKLETK